MCRPRQLAASQPCKSSSHYDNIWFSSIPWLLYRPFHTFERKSGPNDIHCSYIQPHKGFLETWIVKKHYAITRAQLVCYIYIKTGPKNTGILQIFFQNCNVCSKFSKKGLMFFVNNISPNLYLWMWIYTSPIYIEVSKKRSYLFSKISYNKFYYSRLEKE